MHHAPSSTAGEPRSRGQHVATVLSNRPLCQDHYELVFRVPEFPPTRPGQFVQVACRSFDLSDGDGREIDWDQAALPRLQGIELSTPLAFLRRPFSLAGRVDAADGAELRIIHRVVGVGTEWLSRLRAGDRVHVLGPLGNHFEPPAAEGIAVLVGGGVGIPPMLYLASTLAGRRAVAFCGALRRDLLPLTITADAPAPGASDVAPLYNIHEFAQHGIPAVITTDDGSYGFKGYVTDALARYLDEHFASPSDRARVTLYTCGPELMMKRVGAIAAERGIACQISVERAMACGMGTCQSCCIRVLKPDPAQPPLAGNPWAYRLACTDGPVFRAAELLW